MKKVLALGAAVAVAGVVGVGALSASALTRPADGTGAQVGARQGMGQGYGRQASLEARAKVFGMTAEELQTALQTKTMSQIAVEKGLSQADFEAKMTEMAKARWQDRGLTAEQIAERVADREQRQATNQADHEWGSGDGNHQGGYGGYGRNR